jgi:hypothetical protein
MRGITSFAAFLALVVAFLTFAVFLLGLPGRIAIARRHPEGEAVKSGSAIIRGQEGTASGDAPVPPPWEA